MTEEMKNDLKLWADGVISVYYVAKDAWYHVIRDEELNAIFSQCRTFPDDPEFHIYEGIELLAEALEAEIEYIPEPKKGFVLGRKMIKYKGCVFFELDCDKVPM